MLSAVLSRERSVRLGGQAVLVPTATDQSLTALPAVMTPRHRIAWPGAGSSIRSQRIRTRDDPSTPRRRPCAYVLCANIV